MKKRVFGRQFKRDINERKALFRGLASSLVLHERIETTEEKAKAIKGSVEKMVTKAKKKDAHMATRLLSPHLHSDAVKKMITEIAPRFADRPGGYTRIIKLGNRFSDNASMVVMEWVVKSSGSHIPTPVAKESSETRPSDTVESRATTAKVSKQSKSKSTTKEKKAPKKPVAKKSTKKEKAK